MLSAMESIGVEEQLTAAERGAAAPYVNYPPTPWWYAPSVGAWAAAMIGTFVWWRENAVLFVASLAVLIAVEALFVVWMRRRHGALPMPGKGTPPTEIAAVWREYVAALPVVTLVVGLVWWLVGVPAAAGAAFVLVTVGLAVYERRYAAAAARTRARLR
ncbi:MULTISPECIES: hypothetical protein [unclassified Micromonospora]|uniref:hypothetical protein n=1 Tax=Micromonospora sp. NPDC005206 TaxID=3157022 RepID=UPI0033B2DDF0